MKGLAAVLVIVLVWTSGLVAFAERVARLTPAAAPVPADGVVALTGGSSVRLKAAMDLLEDGDGRRLLVSGVDRKVTRAELWGVTGAAKPLFDCCVDLGFEAANTIGNARETAAWARAMHYDSLILVTADFHTPRALLDMHGAMPKVRISAYPVVTPDLDVRHWQDTTRGADRMAVEYSKYLVTLARESLLGLDGKPERTGAS